MITAGQKAEIIHRPIDMFASYAEDGVRPYTMVPFEGAADGGFGRADAVFDLI